MLIDNLDSFTYNIVSAFEHLGAEVIIGHGPVEGITHLVLGPGPGSPSARDVGLLHYYLNQVPILGICLGHQTIGAAFGAKIVRANEPRHGKVESIQHDGMGLFQGVKNPLEATRYHSLVIDKKTLPASLEVTANASMGEIMGVRHRKYFVEGVQFHPEAIASSSISSILSNFLGV